jgi:hypothetical protein
MIGMLVRDQNCIDITCDQAYDCKPSFQLLFAKAAINQNSRVSITLTGFNHQRITLAATAKARESKCHLLQLILQHRDDFIGCF